MVKPWLVARLTYLLGVRSGTFLMLTFGLPILMILPATVAALQTGGTSLSTLGYVDETGKLPPTGNLEIGGRPIPVRAFADVDAARSAQIDGAIDAYLVVPADYFDGEAVLYFGPGDPRLETRSALADFLRRSLLPDLSPDMVELIGAPLANLTFGTTESGSIFRDQPEIVVRAIIHFALAALFGFLVMTNASQMAEAMIREKNDRALEMVITSLPAWQLVAGKVLAVTLLSLTQVAVWALGALIAMALALPRLLPGLPIDVPLDVLGWALVLFVPAYFLYAVLAAGLGILADNPRQARQLIGAFGVFAMAPFLALSQVMNAPNGPVSIVLGFFPLTSPTIMVIRMAGAAVPEWQLLIAGGLSAMAFLGSLWLTARMFRAAVLLYGQPLRLHTLVRAMRAGDVG